MPGSPAELSKEDTRQSNGKRKRAARLGPELRRPMILDVAYEAFRENGYDGVSMSAIAEQAGVTKPVIYDCFANKDELFDALRARERDRIIAAVVSSLPEDAQVDLESALIAGLAAMLGYIKSDPEAFRMIVLAEGASGETAIRIERSRAEYVETVAAILEDWGRPADESPRIGVQLIAHTLVGASEGVARAVMNDPERFDPDAAARLVARFLARGALAL
jgi:AcrR family transcriptional regulator